MSADRTISVSDGVTLALHDWSLQAPRLTVAVVHGYGEHGGRYAELARFLNARGLGVVSVDLRGHGRSSGGRGAVLSFEDYHRDVEALLQVTFESARGRPVAMLGHSMGGLLAAHWLLAHPEANLAAAVLSSPYLGLSLPVGAPKIALAHLLSRVLPKVSLPSGLAGKDVCRDPDLVRLYDTDPLNVKTANARWFTEALRAIDKVFARAHELALPMLVLYGGDDRVASADATDRFVGLLTSKDRETERLAGLYHEILNEPKATREAIMARIAEWLLRHETAGR